MVFGQVVIGPPGSGKTTYCNGMSQFLQLIGRSVPQLYSLSLTHMSIHIQRYMPFFFDNSVVHAPRLILENQSHRRLAGTLIKAGKHV